MRKFTKSIAALCCFAVLCSGLCACSQNAGSSAGESESSSQNEELMESVLPISYASKSSGSSDGIQSESNDFVTLNGTPLPADQQTEFSANALDLEWAGNVIANGYAGAFLDTLDNAEHKDLYRLALASVHLISTDNFIPSEAIAQGENRAYITVSGENAGTYLESGYTYDSFVNFFYSVFTRETADKLLSRYPIFYSYNGELWYQSTTITGPGGVVFQEYEMISQTDTVLEFKRINYSVAIGEPLEYDPSKKDEYEKTEVNFKFVNVGGEWKAERFLNADDLSKPMLFM